MANSVASVQCQCNADWLQNQTTFWMGKWLNSSNFASQLRAYVFSSVASVMPQATKQQNLNGPSSSRASGSSLAWNRQASKRHNNTNNNQHQASSSPQAVGKWHQQHRANNNYNSNPQQPTGQVKLVQGERGPKVSSGRA